MSKPAPPASRQDPETQLLTPTRLPKILYRGQGVDDLQDARTHTHTHEQKIEFVSNPQQEGAIKM